MQEIKAKIAGWFNFPASKEPTKALKPGDALHWRAEPTNKFDPNAIELFVPMAQFAVETSKVKDMAAELINHNGSDFIKCGYIPKAIAAGLKANRISAITRGEKFDEIIIVVAGETT